MSGLIGAAPSPLNPSSDLGDFTASAIYNNAYRHFWKRFGPLFTRCIYVYVSVIVIFIRLAVVHVLSHVLTAPIALAALARSYFQNRNRRAASNIIATVKRHRGARASFTVRGLLNELAWYFMPLLPLHNNKNNLNVSGYVSRTPSGAFSADSLLHLRTARNVHMILSTLGTFVVLVSGIRTADIAFILTTLGIVSYSSRRIWNDIFGPMLHSIRIRYNHIIVPKRIIRIPSRNASFIVVKLDWRYVYCIPLPRFPMAGVASHIPIRNLSRAALRFMPVSVIPVKVLSEGNVELHGKCSDDLWKAVAEKVARTPRFLVVNELEPAGSARLGGGYKTD